MNNVKRYNVDKNIGLNNEQINERKNNNLVNYDTTVPTKTIGQIVSSNIFTLFNMINIILAICVILVGSYKNVFFMGVIICNIVIGIFQEIRSKIVIDKLSVIASKKVKVIRNSKKIDIEINEIVLDDVICFELGNQVVVDSCILDGEVEVNESFITGESDTIKKKSGDLLLSGSFIVSGDCIAKVEHIGDENYTSKISSEAKYLKKVNSEIMNSLNKIVKFVSFVIFPTGLLLFIKQMYITDSNLQSAVVSTVAAMIGMIPEGLVLLTSTVLAVSVIRLSRKNVLVQELFCIETLSRVDTLCLDKTGTLTEGSLEVIDLIDLNEENNLLKILSTYSNAFSYRNATMDAIYEKFYKKNKSKYKILDIVNFSSEKKYSLVTFDIGTFVLGAPEYIISNMDEKLSDLVKKYTKEYRVLLFASCNDKNFSKVKPLCLILLQDKIKKDAKETINYFKEQGVDIKIISGDNPETVAFISKKCGVDVSGVVDARNLLNSSEIDDAIKNNNIFGRVSPSQKKEIILALKRQGHIVAMTGDGVNDVLALKEADCSIAFSNGSDASKNVSQLVLLDSSFSSLPSVVLEGRRSINNLQRSATLFLVKTIYSLVLSLLFIFIPKPYPFIPIHLTLTSVVTIGIPSFVLALEPNRDRIKGNFIFNVVGKAVPTALMIVINILIIMILSSILNLNYLQSSTLCVVLTGFTGFTLLYHISKPLNILRTSLFVVMVSMFLIEIVGFKNWYSLSQINIEMLIISLILMIITSIISKYLNEFTYKLIKKYTKE